MKTDEIKILLDAFYSGKTSVEEEKQLLHYFESGDIVEELQNDKLLFIELYNSPPIDIPDNLGIKLDDFIDKLELKDRNKQVSHNSKKKVRIILTSIAAFAACIALFFLVTTVYKGTDINVVQHAEESASDELKDTYTNPEDAQKAAYEALMKVSTKLNKGFGELSFAASNYEKNTEKIQKKKSRTRIKK